MKKLRPSFPRSKLFLPLALIAVLGLTGSCIWYAHSYLGSKPNTANINTFNTVSGCSPPAKPIQVDPSVIAEAKAAFIAKGFTGAWLDQHFQLISSETHTDMITGPSTNWQSENQVVTVLSYEMCVGDYKVVVNYDHTNGDDNRNFAEIYAPAHDIHTVITLKEAQHDLTQCGGKLSGVPAGSVSFRDIEDSGALYPKQTRLYLTGNISRPGGGSSVQGQQGGIIRSSQANIDLETGKCFITTTTIGI